MANRKVIAVLLAVFLQIFTGQVRASTCKTIKCRRGYVCVERLIYCFIPPCPTQASCVRRCSGFPIPIPKEVTCLYDSECGYGKRCCSSGYGTVCKRKYKPGYCPFLQPNICVHQCYDDFDCYGKYICCSNGCGKICTHPIFPYK